MRLELEQILNATGGQLVKPQAPSPKPAFVTGVSTDSRTVRPGDLFVPLRGPRTDGHEYVADAFRRGAAAALCARPVDNVPPGATLITVADPLRALGEIAAAYRAGLSATVVGITGSVGKTTTTKMCADVLGTRFRVARTRDDWNAEIGVPLTLLELEADHQVAVVEMAMRGVGQLADLVRIAQPSVGVVTTIGESHLELLGTIDNVARAKGELVAGLPADGTAVLNADDPRVIGLGTLSRARVITYGLDSPAHVRAAALASTDRGMRFHLSWEGRGTDVDLPAWGRHNVRNALAAASVALVLGMDLVAVHDGLAASAPPKMRLQPVLAGDLLIINDAYNASPASMDAAFEVLQEAGRGRRLVAVLGEMKELGEASARMHRQVGASIARRPVALLITVEWGGDQIADGAEQAGLDRSAIIRTASVEEASGRLLDLIRPNDVVLVKGSRALEMERIVDRLVEAASA